MSDTDTLTAPKLRMIQRLREFCQQHMQECACVDVHVANGLVYLCTARTVYTPNDHVRRKIIGPLIADYQYLRDAAERLYDEM